MIRLSDDMCSSVSDDGYASDESDDTTEFSTNRMVLSNPTMAGQPLTGKARDDLEARNDLDESDDLEESDDIPDLPTSRMVLLNPTMARQPLIGQVKDDLQSVRTVRSLPPGKLHPCPSRISHGIMSTS